MNEKDAPPPEKIFPVSWDQFHRDSRALAWRLNGLGPFHAVVAITRGGLVPAAIVARTEHSHCRYRLRDQPRASDRNRFEVAEGRIERCRQPWCRARQGPADRR